MKSYEDAWPVDALLKQYLSNTSTGFKRGVKAAKKAGEDIDDPDFINALLDGLNTADEDEAEDAGELEADEDTCEEPVPSSSRQIQASKTAQTR